LTNAVTWDGVNLCSIEDDDEDEDDDDEDEEEEEEEEEEKDEDFGSKSINS